MNIARHEPTELRPLRLIVALAIASLLAAPAFADPRSQAKRLHDRLAGVPPTDAVLTQMQNDIAANNATAAALLAIDNPSFYNVTLKNWVTPWTNREQTVFAPLNDYTATVIGMIRDDEPFNTVLSADILYTANASAGVAAYSPSNNDHYQQLDDQGADLKAVLQKTTQSSLLGVPAAATAGVLTTRAAAAAFFIAGTNRAMFRFTMINHMCRDMDAVMDITRPPDRIRQDVSRSPGGDSRIFLNNCIGCHSGMDPMAQAFAYYNYDATMMQMLYSAPQVQAKYSINTDNFKPGYVTQDDHWDNYWRKGPNQVLGWDPQLPGSGSGAKTLGQELAASDAFAQCQVEKAFKAVCLRAPGNAADRAKVAAVTAAFKAGGYKMKQVFADTAVYCMGD
jgi:hypothetical protein